MKPDYINFKEGTIFNKRARPEYGASICQVEAPKPFFWVFYSQEGFEKYGHCYSLEEAENTLFEYINNCECYLATHHIAEERHDYHTNEQRRQKEAELQKTLEIKQRIKPLYQDALLIAPGITHEQYEKLIMETVSAGVLTLHYEFPFF